MPLVDLIIMFALFEYLLFSIATGRARERYAVRAPATTGHPLFERYYRVQMNTLELLILFIPSVWLFARYADARWAAALGAVFIVGRALYFFAYVKEPGKRNVGFGVSALPVLALMLGATIGAALSWYRA